MVLSTTTRLPEGVGRHKKRLRTKQYNRHKSVKKTGASGSLYSHLFHNETNESPASAYLLTRLQPPQTAPKRGVSTLHHPLVVLCLIFRKRCGIEPGLGLQSGSSTVCCLRVFFGKGKGTPLEMCVHGRNTSRSLVVPRVLSLMASTYGSPSQREGYIRLSKLLLGDFIGSVSRFATALEDGSSLRVGGMCVMRGPDETWVGFVVRLSDGGGVCTRGAFIVLSFYSFGGDFFFGI